MCGNPERNRLLRYLDVLARGFRVSDGGALDPAAARERQRRGGGGGRGGRDKGVRVNQTALPAASGGRAGALLTSMVANRISELL